MRSYNINSAIKAPEVRLIDEYEKQVGVVTIADALSRARNIDMDLVEVNSNVVPPIVKIINYDKLMYSHAKREKEIRKNQRDPKVRLFNLRSTIASNDIQTNARKIVKLLKSKKTVRVQVTLKKGREEIRRSLADDVMNQLIGHIDNGYTQYQISAPLQFEKGVLSITLTG